MDDLISRQDAIDALEWKWAGKAAIDAIKNLPSAQPELNTMLEAEYIRGFTDGIIGCTEKLRKAMEQCKI